MVVLKVGAKKVSTRLFPQEPSGVHVHFVEKAGQCGSVEETSGPSASYRHVTINSLRNYVVVPARKGKRQINDSFTVL